MDMSFANQSLACELIVKDPQGLPEGVSALPREIDAEIARLKLVALGVEIDELTVEQRKYLASWEMGT
jgi:adenosylhomocysteinase